MNGFYEDICTLCKCVSYSLAVLSPAVGSADSLLPSCFAVLRIWLLDPSLLAGIGW